MSRRGGVFARLRGLWRSHGYGTLLEVGATSYRVYEETRVSCLGVFEGPIDELPDFFVDVRVSPRARAFSARRASGVTRLKYRRLGALPRGYIRPDGERHRDPVLNFEVFWHTFAERYALFDLRGVDWAATYAAHRPRVDDDTSARELFEVFVDMLRPLGDGHVELRASYGNFSPSGVSLPRRRLARQLGLDVRGDAALRRVFELRDRSRAIIRSRYLATRPRRAANGLLEWGRLDEGTGYLAIEAMAGLSGANRARRDQQAAATGMERALRELGHLPALVVDVRRNGGGYDGVAMRIAGYLIDRRRLAFAKTASKIVGYGARQTVFVEPRGTPRYEGRIFLLTSGLTASAAEIFVLALLERPELTRLGEPTLGEQSDVMERHLPNGWELHLSNELYHASDDEIYEDRGVPPDVAIPFLDLNDIEAGRDPMLDFVLAQR
jgi:hypothetical protein